MGLSLGFRLSIAGGGRREGLLITWLLNFLDNNGFFGELVGNFGELWGSGHHLLQLDPRPPPLALSIERIWFFC